MFFVFNESFRDTKKWAFTVWKHRCDTITSKLAGLQRSDHIHRIMDKILTDFLHTD